MDWSRLLMGAFVVAAVAAHAQSPAPLMTGSSATKLQYESAFTGYRPFAEAELLSWKRANGDAAASTGQGGHVMRDSTADTAASAASATTTRSAAPAFAPTGHASHPR